MSLLSYGANDFTNDPNAKALWIFENDALDSIGGNDWNVDDGSPQFDSGTFKEGAYSVDMLGKTDNDSYIMSDAGGDLDADFPLKNGDTNKKISICMWAQLQSTPAGSGTRDVGLYLKGGGTTRSIRTTMEYTSDSTNFSLSIGYNSGSNWETVQHASSITNAALLGNWYHVGWTYQDSDKTYRIRIWDDNAGAILGSDLTGTMSNSINVENGAVKLNEIISGSSNGDVFYDELVLFDDILTADEIDSIRAGIFGATGQGQVIIISKKLDYDVNNFLRDFVRGTWEAS
jgi:hypothetical protein